MSVVHVQSAHLQCCTYWVCTLQARCVLTSVMTMTEMPQGRQIRGSLKNLLASSKPNKLDCIHQDTCAQTVAQQVQPHALRLMLVGGQLGKSLSSGYSASKQCGTVQTACCELAVVTCMDVQQSTCMPVSKLIQRATGMPSEPGELVRIIRYPIAKARE